MFKKGKILSKLRTVLDAYRNPYVEITNEVMVIVKRNNDIIKSN